MTFLNPNKTANLNDVICTLHTCFIEPNYASLIKMKQLRDFKATYHYWFNQIVNKMSLINLISLKMG